MLIDHPSLMVVDQITALISSLGGPGRAQRRLRTGVYEIAHFGNSRWPEGFESYPELADGASPYGVCDDVDQIVKAYPDLETPGRSFAITVTRIIKAEEPNWGGWRWHKWGPYIGTKTPTMEYLHDEPDIDEVLVFHIYELKGDK